MDASLLIDHHSSANGDTVVRALLSISGTAQGLTVTLTLHPDVPLTDVHSDWPRVNDNGTVTFDLGDLYVSEPKPLLFEMRVPSHATSARVIVATLKVQAHVLTPSGGVELRTLSLPIAATLDGQSLMVPEVERAILMARSAKAREEAGRRQREGRVSNERRGKRTYDAQLRRGQKPT